MSGVVWADLYTIKDDQPRQPFEVTLDGHRYGILMGFVWEKQFSRGQKSIPRHLVGL